MAGRNPESTRDTRPTLLRSRLQRRSVLPVACQCMRMQQELVCRHRQGCTQVRPQRRSGLLLCAHVCLVTVPLVGSRSPSISFSSVLLPAVQCT